MSSLQYFYPFNEAIMSLAGILWYTASFDVVSCGCGSVTGFLSVHYSTDAAWHLDTNSEVNGPQGWRKWCDHVKSVYRGCCKIPCRLLSLEEKIPSGNTRFAVHGRHINDIFEAKKKNIWSSLISMGHRVVNLDLLVPM